MTPLGIPDVSGLDTLAAAFKYAAAGWYVGPLVNGSKHPGSRLGKDWQAKTSRDPEVISAWFAGRDDGIFLHCGRSGAIVCDVDRPDQLAGVLLAAIGDAKPPRQSTRVDHPGRGHYVFTQPPSRTLGNGLGRLPGGWGELRGLNGVIVVEPTQHEKAGDGGRYKWERVGPVPLLPEAVAELLHDSSPGADAATDSEVRAFLDEHTAASRPDLLNVLVSTFEQKVSEGMSRHDRMLSVCAGAMAEARAGFYPAKVAMDKLEQAFLAAVTQPGHGEQGSARTTGTARSEWHGISAWAVAQAKAADINEVRARVASKVPDADDLSWIPEEQPITTDPDTGKPRTTPGMFFTKEGLLAIQLTKAVLAVGPLTTDHAQNLYRFHAGVWQRDGDRTIRERVAELLMDKYRMAHAATVTDILRNREPQFNDSTWDTTYLNLPNGLLDWRTGTLHPHDPAVASVNRIPVEWDPGATCPATDKWLREVFPPDARQFVEEVIGYTLYNDNPLHKAVLLYGHGRNGKGTFLRLLRTLVGDQNISAVTPQSLDENRFRAADLQGKLANLVGDVDPRIFKATETFKQITGGDIIVAERKHGQPFQFYCRALVVAAFNALPRSSDTSEGFFSRWIVVPFAGYFPAGVADTDVEDRLHAPAELRGLLVLAVRGLARLMARGHFELPASVEHESAAFRRVADPVRAFLDDYLPSLLVEWVPRTAVYNEYVKWAEMNGHNIMAGVSFYERLEAAGADCPSHTITARKREGTRGFLFREKAQNSGQAGAGGAPGPTFARDAHRGKSGEGAPPAPEIACVVCKAQHHNPNSLLCAPCLDKVRSAS